MKEYRNKLTVYCNYPVSPIKNTVVNTEHIPLNIRIACDAQVKNYLKPNIQRKYSAILNKVVLRYLEMCAAPLEDDAERDSEGYILFQWNLETMSFTPMARKALVVLIYDTVSTGLDGKHLKINTNWETALNMLRYFVFTGKLDDTSINIVFNNRGMKEIYGITKSGKFINDADEIVELPAGFFDVDLNELLEMM